MSISIKGYNNVALKINSNSSDQIVYKNHIYTLNNMDFEKNDNTSILHHIIHHLKNVNK